jgi:DNA-binding CsgD family transcriptional regulator
MPQSVALIDSQVHTTVTSQGNMDLASIVRRLIDQNDFSSPTPDQSATDEIVLGVEVDGVSYALVRLARQNSPGMASLSPREREIVRLVAKGCPNKTVAAVLDVSTWTVATHLRRVFAKLGVNTRTEMVAQALTHGLIETQ